MIPIRSSIPLSAPQGNERQKLAEAATQFEAIFVRHMLAAARKTDFGSDLFGGQGEDTFRQMMDDRFADIMAENGSLGFAKTIEGQLAARLGTMSAEDGKG